MPNTKQEIQQNMEYQLIELYVNNQRILYTDFYTPPKANNTEALMILRDKLAEMYFKNILIK